MEGLYLHMLIYSTLSTERRGVRVYVVMGWSESVTAFEAMFIFLSFSLTLLSDKTEPAASQLVWHYLLSAHHESVCYVT